MTQSAVGRPVTLSCFYDITCFVKRFFSLKRKVSKRSFANASRAPKPGLSTQKLVNQKYQEFTTKQTDIWLWEEYIYMAEEVWREGGRKGGREGGIVVVV